MPPNIYTLDNHYFRSAAFRVYKWIENATRLPIKIGQSTIWEYMGTPAQDVLIEGGVTLEGLKNIFHNGMALDHYSWTVPVGSVYIRMIPITRCPDGSARRENGTTISKEDMANIWMKDIHQWMIEAMVGHPIQRRPSSPSFMTCGH